MLVSKVIRDPSAKLLMGLLETKVTKVRDLMEFAALTA